MSDDGANTKTSHVDSVEGDSTNAIRNGRQEVLLGVVYKNNERGGVVAA